MFFTTFSWNVFCISDVNETNICDPGHKTEMQLSVQTFKVV